LKYSPVCTTHITYPVVVSESEEEENTKSKSKTQSQRKEIASIKDLRHNSYAEAGKRVYLFLLVFSSSLRFRFAFSLCFIWVSFISHSLAQFASFYFAFSVFASLRLHFRLLNALMLSLCCACLRFRFAALACAFALLWLCFRFAFVSLSFLQFFTVYFLRLKYW
jgi:hypothetical protein